MKSVKLNTDAKQYIAGSMKARFMANQYQAAGYVDEQALVTHIGVEYKSTMKKLWLSCYSDKLHNVLCSLPDWCVNKQEFGVQAGREVHKAYLDNMPGKGSKGLDLVLDDAMDFDKYRQLKKLHEDLKAEGMKFYRECLGVIEACSTSKKLLDAWPEAVEHLPAWIVNQGASSLPVLSVLALNEKLKGASHG